MWLKFATFTSLHKLATIGQKIKKYLFFISLDRGALSLKELQTFLAVHFRVWGGGGAWGLVYNNKIILNPFKIDNNTFISYWTSIFILFAFFILTESNKIKFKTSKFLFLLSELVQKTDCCCCYCKIHFYFCVGRALNKSWATPFDVIWLK